MGLLATLTRQIVEGSVSVEEAREVVIRRERLRRERGARRTRKRIRLTGRRLDILRLIAEGKADKEIRTALNLGHTTVRYHIELLRKYFAAGSRTNLVTRAFREGILH